MAQERGIEYNVPVTSFQHNQMKQGLYPAGIYRGFDTAVNAGGGLNIQFTHSNGLQRVDISNNFEAALRGLAIMPQGTLISTDEEPTLPFDDTPGDQRVDLVVLNYEYNQVTGGATATYSVITGTPVASIYPYVYPAAPSLPNPNKQIIIGKVYWQATGITPRAFSDAKFVPADTPMFNDNELYQLNQDNVIGTGMTYYNNIPVITSANVSGNNLSLPVRTNKFYVDLNGADITLTRISAYAPFDGTSANPDDETVITAETELEFVIFPDVNDVSLKIQTSGSTQAGFYPIHKFGGAYQNIPKYTTGTIDCKQSVKFRYYGSFWQVLDFQNDIDDAPWYGRWQDVTVTNTEMAASAGTWTISGGTVGMKYHRIGKVVTVYGEFSSTNTSDAVVGAFYIDANIPGTSTPFLAGGNVAGRGFGKFVNSATPAGSGGNPGQTAVNVYYSTTNGRIEIAPLRSSTENFYCGGGADNISIYFQLTYEVQ